MHCVNCRNPIPAGSGFVVLESELINGIGMAVIKADCLDPDAAGKRACGLMCLNVHVSRRLGELAGVKPMFPERTAV